MNIDAALEKIYSLKQFHIKLGLENITNLLNHIGNPHKKLQTFHVAGSNGKGSTCSFIASVLQEHGFKVGIYTSPHFLRFNERIRINGKEISGNEIIKFLEKNKKYIDKEKPTFFEITTALAFHYFYIKKVDYAVIETGLGGRLDATNTINPLASVITSISLEHTRILGNTLEKIAFEKAGIIKNKTPVIIGKLPTKAKKVVDKIAAVKKSKLFDFKDFAKISAKKILIKLKNGEQKFSFSSLSGIHQQINAALAIKTLDAVKIKLNYNKICVGLDNVIKNTGLQGRFEIVNETPRIIFDSSHNVEGIKSFITQFKKDYNKFSNCILIYGALNDKDNKLMLSKVKPYFNKVYVTNINNERSESSKNLYNIASGLGINVTKTNFPEKIINSFRTKKNRNSCLVVLGSIYLLGEIKSKLLKN